METAQAIQPFVGKFSGKAQEIAASKSFTYPTRLAAAWTPDILEINHPAHVLNRGDIKIYAVQGSTRSTAIPTRNIFRKAYRNRVTPLSYENEYLFDCRFDTDRNIAHIMARMVAPALAAKRFLPNLKVVIDANPSAMVTTIFGLLEIPTICTDRNLLGKIVSLPKFDVGDYEVMYRSLFGSFRFPQANHQTPDRVFIARKGERRLINEPEIEALLREYGFQKFYYEDIPIYQQWAVTQNAKCIVALHGAALSSLVFNHNTVKLVELFHPGYVVNMYRNIVNAVGGSWCGVTGQITADVIEELDFKQKARAFALHPTKIDPRSLRMALEYMQIAPV